MISLTDSEVSPALTSLAERGQVWAISKWMPGQSVTSYMAEILMDIQNTAETVRQTVKIHQAVYHQSEVEATFTLGYGLERDILVVLYIDDEVGVVREESAGQADCCFVVR